MLRGLPRMNPARLLIVGLVAAAPAFGAPATSAAVQIPARFQGVWGLLPAGCTTGSDRIVIRTNLIAGIGGESGWQLKRVLQNDGRHFAGLYDFGGEGLEEHDARLSLHLLSGRKLRFDDSYWKYCRRPDRQ